MIFIDEKPVDIPFFACTVIATYAGMVIVPRAADGHGIVQKNFYT